MSEEKSFWQRIGLHDWFLKNDAPDKLDGISNITPDDVYHYLIEKFRDSMKVLSFADRIVFYHEYIICFNAEDYNEFMETKKGLFGLIAHETVKEFHKILKEYRTAGKVVVASSNKWVFRFVSHPDYSRGDKGFIGKLLPEANLQKADNLRVTYIPRQTGIAQTLDINEDILKGFNFYSDGYYEIPYQEDLETEASMESVNGRAGAKAKLEVILPDKTYSGKKVEYLLREDKVTVSGSDEATDAPGVFRIPSDWVNSPHLFIRYDKNDGKFYVSSFGEKTIVNETEMPRSTVEDPEWTELPLNSHMVLNGIVGINIFKA
jgi:hypothetical protein